MLQLISDTVQESLLLDSGREVEIGRALPTEKDLDLQVQVRYKRILSYKNDIDTIYNKIVVG